MVACCSEEADEASKACHLVVARAVTPEKDEVDLAAKMRSETFAVQRQRFVESCRELSAAGPTSAESYYERKLARRDAAHASALAEAEAQYGELSEAFEALQRSHDDLIDQLEAKDAALRTLRADSERRTIVIRATVERQFNEKLQRELRSRETVVAARLARAARLRETDLARHKRELKQIANDHEVHLAKQGAAYASLARKYDELKSTLARLAQACRLPQLAARPLPERRVGQSRLVSGERAVV